jgi:phosphatidylserine/phosphatidylglycerophosphate/cardiolipin synthase-like enzyme
MRSKAAVILILLLVTAVPFACEDACAANDEHLWLYEIITTGSFESVTVYNGGTSNVNMKNYYLDDGEGTLRFTNDLIIGPKGTASFCSNVPEEWFTGRNVYVYGTNGLVAKSFILADNGDEVSLKRTSGEVLDAFVYGNGDTSISGWKGEAFSRIPAGKAAVRSSAFDTDTAADWKLTVIGRTEEKITSSGTFNALVTPFVFPDSKGYPIFNALENAQKEVLISMYVMDHKEIVSLLVMLLERGVSVTILLEGSPVGGVPDTELRYMNLLCGKGADVYMIKSNNGYKRYDLVHNKYAIIDSKTVAVTSENWREGSFNGNRGWGALIESKDYAEYMKKIFADDCNNEKYDIFELKSLYSTISPITVTQYRIKDVQSYTTYEASVKPVLSPDFSFEYLKREITNASYRVYSQQMSIQYAWTDVTSSSPVSWSLTAAGNGADVRILADVTFDDTDSSSWNGMTISLINDMEGLQARVMSNDGFSLTHNKGVIIDDTVWISSVNWTNAAFMNNREVAVAVISYDVSEYYASYFLTDWGCDADVGITVSVRGNVAGEPIVLDASSSSYPYGSLFEWDLDGNGHADRTGVKIATIFGEGVHECVLYVTEPSGMLHVHEFIVIAVKKSNADTLEPYIKYAPILAVMLLILIIAAVTRIRERRR